MYKFRKQVNDVLLVFTKFLPGRLAWFFPSKCQKDQNHQVNGIVLVCSGSCFDELQEESAVVFPCSPEGWDGPGQPWQK